MSKIDISGWGEFKVGDLFSVQTSKSIDKLHLNFETEGQYEFIGRTTLNNGVQGKLNELPFEPNADKTYSVAQIGTNVCQYRDTKWYSSQNIFILTPLDDTMNIANKFITTIITTTLKNVYGEDAYSSYPTLKTLPNVVLKLPINSQGDPDWQYMEDYMRAIEVRVDDLTSKLEFAQKIKNNKIDISDWGEFTVGTLFNIKPTKAYKLTNAELLDGGENPVVVNSAYNNGIGGTSSKDATEKGNMITFSDTVDANTIFYQEYPFVGYPHVQGLYPIGQYATYWNKANLMFFASSFRKSALVKGFDYGNKFRRDIASTLKVKLPIDSNGDPDWQYMENYMEGLEIMVNNFVYKTE